MSYFKGVIAEAKRVEWPKGKELTKMVFSVTEICAFFAIIFIVMDLLINLIMKAMGI
ncbi:preprotein translocase subunit SecE [Mycoplasma sp. P36-A1]|uniref:preprotein translocase subunit SecE n=1 Tax=Mycoplasma sp. P36-A1 TaxID=3252900 RepID=UPI003C2ACB63